MTRGRQLTEDLRRTLVYMYRTCSIPDTVKYTGCKKRTIQRILLQHRTHSVYPRFGNTRERPGKRRVLISEYVLSHILYLYLPVLVSTVPSRPGSTYTGRIP
jgi:hypothetical protein